MKFLLIKADNNYADEFDVEGFSLYQGESATRALSLIKLLELVPDTEISFGTNESVQLHQTSFEVKEITKEEYGAIANTLGEQYGLLNVDTILCTVEDTLSYSEHH